MIKLNRALPVILSALICLGGCSAVNDSSGKSDESKISTVLQSSTVQESSSTSKDDTSESTDVSKAVSEASHESSIVSESPKASEISEISENSETSSDNEEKAVISSKYFAGKLNDTELEAFEELYSAVRENKKKVVFKNEIPSEMLDKLMQILNYDCPELINVMGDYSPSYNEDESYAQSVGLYYNMNSEKYKKCCEELKEFFDDLRTKLKGKSDYEKEKYVYDYIFQNCMYDEYTANSGSVYGALIEHKARCEGISKAFMLCMRELGIDCITVVGVPLWENNGTYSNHSWNIVNIDGDWYHVDVTADNLSDEYNFDTLPLYGFMNSDDKFIYQSRELISDFAKMGVPECVSDKLNYHVLDDSLIKSGSDIENRVYEILSSRFKDGENVAVSIQLEALEDYNKARDLWEKWADEFIRQNTDNDYDNTIFYNRTSRTVIVELIPE